jgi:hypothetical protein
VPFDQNIPVHYVTLKNELTSDPRAYGYAASRTAGDYEDLAVQLNVPRTASNGGVITVRRGIRSGVAVWNCIVLAAFDALTVPRQQFCLGLVTPVEGVDLANDQVRANLGAIFPTGATRSALLAAEDKSPASRIEELYGVDTTVDANIVRTALLNY